MTLVDYAAMTHHCLEQIFTKLHTNFAYKFSIPIVQGWEDDFWENTALGHVAMMPQDRDSLFEPPLPRLQKTSVIFESPLKYIRKRKEQDLFSPDRPTKRYKTYEFVDSAHFTQSKTRCTTRKRSKIPAKPHKNRRCILWRWRRIY